MPGYYFEIGNTFPQFLIGEVGEFCSGDDIVVRVCRIVPQSYLPSYLFCCGRSVAGHYFHLYAGVDYLAYCIRHVGSHGV